MYILNIVVTYAQNTVRGKRIELPDIFTSMEIFEVDKCMKSLQVCDMI